VIDLTTTYLGLTLKSPLVAGPSPLCQSVDAIRAMEDAGAAAVVLHSLFEEQIALESQQLDAGLSAHTESFAESLSYLPDKAHYALGPEEYVEHVRKAKAAVDIPVIASLNGVTPGAWIRYARLVEQAGADGIELNIYYVATDPHATAFDVERRYVELVTAVRKAVKVPLAVKLGPSFTAFANVARQLAGAGANGLVLFNRFYQPDLDIEHLEVVPTLALSTSAELLLRLHWVAVLYGRVKADLAVTGGVHTGHDALKSMMAGAHVAMLTSALLKHGVGHLATVRAEMLHWMEEREYESIAQMRGSLAQKAVKDPAAYERGNYIKVLSSYALA
jgi:dihydroorotate dehydrogenase (fumarate)